MDETLQISNYSKDKERENKNILINNSFANLTLSDIGTNDKKDEINTTNSIIFNNKIDDFNNIFPKKRPKIKKEDLNNIPIPIFSCIYCSNEKIAFNHKINKILEEKYLLLTSIYDMKKIDKLILKKNIRNEIFENMEYFKKYYKYKDAKIILNKYFTNKKDNLNYVSNYITNYSTCSNSISIKFKLDDLFKEQKEKNIKLNINIRKIKKKDIKWDTKFYDIWKPIPEPIYYLKQNSINKKSSIDNKTQNKTPMILNHKNLNTKVYSTLKLQTKEINKKSYHPISTYRNEKMASSKKFLNLFTYTYNNTKKSSKNKNYNKNTITKFITKSNSKNKTHNIIINIKINKTPIKNNQNNFKKISYATKTIKKENKFNSYKNILLKTTNISSNKSKIKYLNINPINIFNSSHKIIPQKNISKNKDNNNINKNINITYFSQNTSLLNSKKYLDLINVLNIFHKKNNKNVLTKNISKKLSRNKTHNKMKNSKEKSTKDISHDALTSIAHKSKIIYKNKPNKYKKKNIEININNIKC